MSKDENTAHDHDHMTIPEHPHRGRAAEVKLRDGDCAVIFRKDDCPEFIMNVPDGTAEIVTSDNFLHSPYYMTDLLFAVYYGNPVMLLAMRALAKLNARTSENVTLLQDDVKEQQSEATPDLDTPVVAIH